MSGNPHDPVLGCQAIARSALLPGRVYWAAMRIQDSMQYDRGCISLCNGFPYLCPGSDPESATPQSCYYMCADAAASESTALGEVGEGRYRMRAEVPILPTDGVLLGDVNNSYQITPPPLP
jgi:hypothetical protein